MRLRAFHSSFITHHFLMERIVTIFGGSKCGEESEEYEQARRLGQLLAERGFTICTGGYLGVRGGAGTVTELSLVWNKLQTKVIEPRPLVLLGRCWPRVIEAFRENLVVSEEDVSLLDFVNTPEEAVRIIVERAGD